MTAVDLAPLAATAADHRRAIGRLEDAAADAEAAWKLLPAALDSPGTQLGVGRFVGPAHQLSTALLQAADAVHSALLAEVQPLRQLEAQAAQHPDDLSWQTRIDTAEASCATTIAAIRGGEAGSVDLPCPDPQAPLGSKALRPASFALPAVPTWGLPGFGGALIDGATAAGAASAAGLLGVLGLVLSLGGSSDDGVYERSRQQQKVSKAEPKEGEDFEVTPYQPCLQSVHGDGCEERHLGVEKPGDEPFTGDKVKGNEEPGDMPGTESDWVKTPAEKNNGWVYEAPDGRTERVMEPGASKRYPNGYVVFRSSKNQPLNLGGKPNGGVHDLHIVRNPNGSFPIPEGWNP